MKPLSELQQGDFVQFVHNTGKIKKGFTVSQNYLVLKVKEYLGASYEFILMSEDGVKRTFKTSTDQFRYYDFKSKEEDDILKNEESAHPWPELNKMAPSDLLALRDFINREIRHYRRINDDKYNKWHHNLAIVQEHIDKSTAHYFGEESKS